MHFLPLFAEVEETVEKTETEKLWLMHRDIILLKNEKLCPKNFIFAYRFLSNFKQPLASSDTNRQSGPPDDISKPNWLLFSTLFTFTLLCQWAQFMLK